MNEQKPGQIVAPQSSPNATQTPQPDQVDPPADTEVNQWQSNQDNSDMPAEPDSAADQLTDEGITWTASEFISHEKSGGWYILLILAALILAAVVYMLTRDKISTAVVVVAAVVLGIFAGRKPRVLSYRLDDDGLTIGSRFYGYNVFKSFSVVEEGAFSGILLMPLKRFMPALTIYYASEDEDKIVTILSDRLPLEHRQKDVVDRFMHKIRF